ncbi:Uu.00g070840.m01.CDS01 [Anthostomella pinea]|uniref:Uu.00g070840.m01.CDS01 n=1 Tax=Anthostomella pinea TaxID=933095 RepID=A0AAI8VVJ9_9PEZI|nr:Uu.00g070840.m01.CDS01 [Anthostomella pinea]
MFLMEYLDDSVDPVVGDSVAFYEPMDVDIDTDIGGFRTETTMEIAMGITAPTPAPTPLIRRRSRCRRDSSPFFRRPSAEACESRIYATFHKFHKSSGNVYDDLVGLLYASRNPQSGLKKAHEGERFTDFDKFTNFGWPAPVLPMTFYYGARPQYLATPNFTKFEAQDTFIAQIILDMALLDTIRSEQPHYPPGRKDRKAPASGRILAANPIHKALSCVWTTGKVSTVAVLAGQILVDLHDSESMDIANNMGQVQALPGNAKDIVEKLGLDPVDEPRADLILTPDDFAPSAVKADVIKGNKSYPEVPRTHARHRFREPFKDGTILAEMVQNFAAFMGQKTGGGTVKQKLGW